MSSSFSPFLPIAFDRVAKGLYKYLERRVGMKEQSALKFDKQSTDFFLYCTNKLTSIYCLVV